MTTKVGVWIDHARAVIVSLVDSEASVKEIASDIDRNPRFAGNAGMEGAEDDMRDRHYAAHLDRFYDEVAAALSDADFMLIMGPGESKGELAKAVERKGLKGHLAALEPADKLSEHQLVARVRAHFHV